MSEDLTRLKMWAMAYGMAPDAAGKRKALYRYLGELGHTVPSPSSGATKKEIQESIERGKEWVTLIAPLAAMQEALRQADHHEVPDIFKDAFKPILSNRPTKSRSEQLCWASASAVMTVLIDEYGKTEREAAQIVLKHLHSRDIDMRGKVDTPAWKRLQSWRDKCMTGAKGDLAIGYYRFALATMMHGKFPPGNGMSQLFTIPQLLDLKLDPPFVGFDPIH